MKRNLVRWVAMVCVAAAAICLPSVAVAASAAASAGDWRVAQLKGDDRVNPLGIDDPSPRLSWICQSGARDASQSAYQIMVASSPQQLEHDQADLWDSGRVSSADSTEVVYGGRPLSSGQQCWWRVRSWDGSGHASAWSEPCSWSMGLLKPGDWSAKWIMLNQPAEAGPYAQLERAHWIWSGLPPTFVAGRDDAPAPAGVRYFRKTFTLAVDQHPASAPLTIFADDSFSLWLNGQPLRRDVQSAVPITVDLAPLLRSGTNVLAVEVTNSSSKFGGAGLIACVKIAKQKGHKEININTDSSWKVADQAAAGWEETGFDDQAWQAAQDLGSFAAGEGARPWERTRPITPAIYLRREFNLSKPLQRATAYVSGLGWSVVRVNGQGVDDAVLQPAVSQYSKRALYVTYDITHHLHRGANALGVVLATGRDNVEQLRLQVNLQYTDGTSDCWTSDEHWRGTDSGPMTEASEYDGESFDARRIMRGWDRPGFDDHAWQAVTVRDEPNVAMSAQMEQPIRVVANLTPIGITQPRPGVYVFDLGQNIAGWCRLTVRGTAGTRVVMQYAETLRGDGTIYRANLRSARATDTFTLAGTGSAEVFEPSLTYHGFRYVQVSGLPAKPDESTLLGCAISNDTPAVGGFRCSNDLLNRLYHNITWGVRDNYNGVPTDCPQRDERLGWLGDRGGECTGESYCFDIDDLYQNWMQDMADTQRPDGSLSDVAPTYYLWDTYRKDVSWPSTYLLAADMLHRQYGQRRQWAVHYESMKRWIGWVSAQEKDGIVSNDAYGDWCPPPEREDLVHSQDPQRQTAGPLIATAYFYHDLRLMQTAADLLGNTGEADGFRQHADRVREAFNRHFFHADTGTYDNGTQTSCVLPLAFDLVPADQRSRVFEHLTHSITHQTDDHLATGLIGCQWLMRTLSENGAQNIAYAIAQQRSYPSWGYMADHGATTMWELWNGNTADPSMNSGNHVMLVGDLNVWLNEDVLGIAPAADEPGFKHVIIHPRPGGGLSFAEGHHDGPYGRIAVRWDATPARFALKVTVPPNSWASVYLPTSDAAQISEGGKPVASAPGVRSVHAQKAQTVVEVGAGSYAFSIKGD